MRDMRFNQPPTLSASLKGKLLINYAGTYSASTPLSSKTCYIFDMEVRRRAWL